MHKISHEELKRGTIYRDGCCLHCLTIYRNIYNNVDFNIDDYTLNGYRVARLIESYSSVTKPERVIAHNRLSSQELSEGRWCKECGKRIR